MLGVETTAEIIPEVYDRLSTTAAMVHKLGGHFNSRQAIAAVIASCLDPVTLKFTRESCEKEKECQDCVEARKHANSDATTPGFFSPFCMKHDPEIKKAVDG